MSSVFTFALLSVTALLVIAAIFSVTFLVGVQEAADPNHSELNNLSELEKKLVDRKTR